MYKRQIKDYQSAEDYVGNGQYTEAIAALKQLQNRVTDPDSAMYKAIEDLLDKAQSAQSDDQFNSDLDEAQSYLDDKKYDAASGKLDSLANDDSLTDDQKKQVKELQKQLLKLMKKYPYMAHNAAFEDSWFKIHLDGYAEARRAGKIIVIDSRQICRSLDADVRSLPRESAPAALENWARRRGTLAADANEQHLGLDDTDLMLRTVQAEFNLKNLFAK